MDIRVLGFRKIRVGLGKTRVGSEFGRTSREFLLGILGQLGHSGTRVSSGKSEPLGHLGQLRAFGFPRMTQLHKSTLYFRPIRSEIFAAHFFWLWQISLRGPQKCLKIETTLRKQSKNVFNCWFDRKYRFVINWSKLISEKKEIFHLKIKEEDSETLGKFGFSGPKNDSDPTRFGFSGNFRVFARMCSPA